MLARATGFHEQGKLVAVPYLCLLSSRLPFLEVNGNSLGKRVVNSPGVGTCHFSSIAVGKAEPLAAYRKYRVMATSLERFLSPGGPGSGVCRQERSLGHRGAWIPL